MFGLYCNCVFCALNKPIELITKKRTKSCSINPTSFSIQKSVIHKRCLYWNALRLLLLPRFNRKISSHIHILLRIIPFVCVLIIYGHLQLNKKLLSPVKCKSAKRAWIRSFKSFFFSRFFNFHCIFLYWMKRSKMMCVKIETTNNNQANKKGFIRIYLFNGAFRIIYSSLELQR